MAFVLYSLANNLVAWWVAQILAIVVLLYFLLARHWGFLGGRTIGQTISSLLDARSAQIQTQLEAAQRSREEAARIHEQAQQQIVEARQEADQIVSRAATARTAIQHEMEERAQQEYQRILAQARAQIDYEREQAELALRRRATDIVIDAAGEVVGRYLQPQADRRIIDTSLSDLKELR